MIITDNNTNESDTKSAPPSPALQSGAGSSHLPPPPAYSGTYSQPATAPIFARELPEVRFFSPNARIKRTEPACKRFFKAFGVAMVIYVILALLTHSVMASTILQSWGPPAGPRPSDGNVVKCFPESQSQQSQVVMSSLSNEYSITYAIPTSSNLVYFLSRGNYGHGTLRFELSDQSGDDIVVNINIRSRYEKLLQHIAVCRLERNNEEHGVGFFTPRGVSWPGNLIQFDVTVQFPRSTSSSPLVIKALETDMQIWKQEFGSLQGHVEFQSLSLSSSNANINVGSVSAITGKVTTSNAPVEGSFNVTDSLVLKTSNSHIKVDIRMENADGHKPTTVDLKTSNAYISAPITLASTASKANYPAAFSVSAATSNSPLKLTFPDAPTSLPFAKLDLTARTSNSPIDVDLHSTFEGEISQRASIFTPKLEVPADTKDPSGGDRARSVSRQLRGHSLTSRVWWGNDQEKANTAKAVVTTSNSPNVVRLS